MSMLEVQATNYATPTLKTHRATSSPTRAPDVAKKNSAGSSVVSGDQPISVTSGGLAVARRSSDVRQVLTKKSPRGRHTMLEQRPRPAEHPTEDCRRHDHIRLMLRHSILRLGCVCSGSYAE